MIESIAQGFDSRGRADLATLIRLENRRDSMQ